MGENDVLSNGLDQSTNYNGNMDIKDNENSKSFEAHKKDN